VCHYALVLADKQTGVKDIIQNMLLKEKALHFLEDIFADIFIQPGIKIGHWNLYWQHQRRT
jgi:hypothetical protein